MSENTRKGNLIAFKGSNIKLEKQKHIVRPLIQGEILVQITYTTLCGSDLHTYSGKRVEKCPTVLGHEIVGKILEFHPSHCKEDLKGIKLIIGDIITWTLFASDSESEFSHQDIPQKGEKVIKYGHCQIEGENVFHGGLAQYCIITKGTGVLKVPKELPLPIAAIINCSLSTVAGALRLAGNIENKNIVIYGMGMLGIAAAAMCKVAGASWIGAVDISQKRLNHSFDFGADETFVFSSEQEFKDEYIKSKFTKNGVDLVFDMSGSPEAMESGLDILCIGGTAIWLGAVFKIRPIHIDGQKVIRNILTIKGLHNYNFDDFVYAYDFIIKNWKLFPFDTIVEKEFDLCDAEQAFEYALTNNPFRVGIKQ